MFMRLTLLLFWVLFSVLPAKAQMHSDRMAMACHDKPLTCQGLVEEIEKKLHFAELVHKGSGFSELWSNTMMEAKALIARLKRDFPGVWEAQHCPLGGCGMLGDTPVPAPDPRFIKPFDPSVRSI